MVAANAFGRQVVVPLTNKSGGGVIAGDVVYLSDGSNADSFTTGTTSAYTGGVGIAQGTIANNAVGLVLIGGYAALVNVNASVTIKHYGYGYTVAKQATDAGTSRIAGTFCQFLTGGTTPDALIWQPDLGGGTGNYTGSTWSSGTSFPVSPATNDRFTRTDRGLDYYYDGTRWLTVNEYSVSLSLLDAVQPFATSPGNDLWGATDLGDNGQWVTRTSSMVIIGATNTGSAYWTFQLTSITSAAVSHNVGGTFATSADSPSTRPKHVVTVGAAVTAGDTHFVMVQTKTGAPSSIYVETIVFYRLIG